MILIDVPDNEFADEVGGSDAEFWAHMLGHDIQPTTFIEDLDRLERELDVKGDRRNLQDVEIV